MSSILDLFKDLQRLWRLYIAAAKAPLTTEAWCAQVMALPCLHQFHAECVEPWLKQNGTASTCPVCKSPVFAGN